MAETLCLVAYRKSPGEPPETLVEKEWLVTNGGLGGYASGSLVGVITRGFHDIW